VLIVDDHPGFRSSARAILERRAAPAQGVRVQPAARARRHPRAADAHRRGPAGGARAGAKHPGTAVLVLSQYVEPDYALELLGENAEGLGYLLKHRVADIRQFAAAVRRVGDGGSALDPSVVSLLVEGSRKDRPLDQLIPREPEVLELMAEGRSNATIAERLVVPSARSRST